MQLFRPHGPAPTLPNSRLMSPFPRFSCFHPQANSQWSGELQLHLQRGYLAVGARIQEWEAGQPQFSPIPPVCSAHRPGLEPSPLISMPIPCSDRAWPEMQPTTAFFLPGPSSLDGFLDFLSLLPLVVAWNTTYLLPITTATKLPLVWFFVLPKMANLSSRTHVTNQGLPQPQHRLFWYGHFDCWPLSLRPVFQLPCVFYWTALRPKDAVYATSNVNRAHMSKFLTQTHLWPHTCCNLETQLQMSFAPSENSHIAIPFKWSFLWCWEETYSLPISQHKF